MRREGTVRSVPPPSPSGARPLSAPPPPISGIRPVEGRVGRYELCFHLAAGGMATVYLARRDGPDGFEKLVALKTIHPHLAVDARFVEMFLDEARIASRISHGNVCQTFDYGEADGTWFIAMEYLVGECFATIYNGLLKRPELRRSPRARATLLAMLAQACEGLHAAHELVDSKGQPLGIVHRDVSHHNVFVTYDGAVKVVDFGIATAADRLHRTATGEVKGKFAYMAPEQARGKRVDRTADVWAIGVMAWELLAGRRLFGRRTEAATVLALTTEPILPPSRHDDTISPALDEAVLKALARKPGERWPTARELGLALVEASGERRGAIGGPEIAELMAELFPEGREARESLADLARRATADTMELPSDLATTLVALAPALSSERTPVTDIREARRMADELGSGEDDEDDEVEAHALSAPEVEPDPEAPPRHGSGTRVKSGARASASVASDGEAPDRRRWLLLGGLAIAAVLGIGIAASVPAPRPAEAPDRVQPHMVASPAPGLVPPREPERAIEAPSVDERPNEGAGTQAERHTETPTEAQTETSELPGGTGSLPSPPAVREPARSTMPRLRVATGTLSVVAPSTWATARVGARSCETPCQLSLPAGSHRVELTVGEARERRVRTVTISGGETTPLVVQP